MKNYFDNELTEDTYDILDDKFSLIKKIGDGATSNVYLAKNVEDSKISAIKILKSGNGEKFKNNYKHFLREMEMLKKINQNNIINITDGKSGGLLKKADNSNERVDYISLELAENGELFDYIYFPKKGFGEEYGRYIFKEMMLGLNACHQAGVVHRDLKTENIMITKDFTLKIADFGYSTLKIGKDNNNLLDSFLGTLSYAAPEILAKKPYFGEAADVFSSGVILFILVTGKLPFGKATVNDDDYRELATKELDCFWMKKSNKFGNLTNEFKSLISLMLSYDLMERPNITEILNHPWLKLKIPSKNEMDEEFTRRDKIVKHQKALEQQEEEERKVNEMKAYEKKLAQKNQRKTNTQTQRVYKAGDSDDSRFENNLIEYMNKNNDSEDLENTHVKHYVPGYNNCKFVIKNVKPNDLLENIISYFYDDENDKRKKHIKVNKDECELNITYKHNKKLLDSIPGIQLQELEIKAEIKTLENSQDLVCEFFKYRGDKMEFYDVYDKCLEYFTGSPQ